MGRARLIDGNAVATKVLEEVAARSTAFAELAGRPPGLAVVLVGEDPASAVYVRMKVRDCGRCGIQSFSHALPATTGQAELLELVESLNRDGRVDGILVQLPLPGGVDETAVLDAIDPAKDVDGFHPANVGRMVRGDGEVLTPCTPTGVMRLLDEERIDPRGMEAVVVGRSDIVGKPMAFLLLHRHATVTICHSRTRDLPSVCRRADILVAAVGRPLMVRPDWVKPGAVVIDVGTNSIGMDQAPAALLDDPVRRAELERKGYALVGDVAPEVAEVAGWLTPSPGGVGPMTRAILMANTVKAAFGRRG